MSLPHSAGTARVVSDIHRMKHQVFVSYRHCDAELARTTQTVLEANNVRCWIDTEGLNVADQWDEKIARAITESALFLLLLTAGSIESPKQQKRELGVAEKYQVPVVPVFLVPTDKVPGFDYLLGNTHYFDASQPPLIERLEQAALEIRRLLHALDLQRLKESERAAGQVRKQQPISPADAVSAPSPASQVASGKSVALLYRREVPEDERLLVLIQQRLVEHGHRVFVDKDLPVGVDWRRMIREKVESADAVIALLSFFSAGSEMLEEEIQIAHRSRQMNGQRPKILPVRVNYEGALTPAMSQCLQHLQYRLWRGPQDDAAVLDALATEVQRPSELPQTAAQQTEMPAGAMPLTSPFYVVREGDRKFQAGIARGESIVLVKGARQMGKTSLIARGLHQARESGARVAITDFQTLSDGDFRDKWSFYCALADLLAEQLGVEAILAERKDAGRAENVSFQRFVRREILGASEKPLVWALDEVDRLFPCPFGAEVFGLFRSWHSARSLNPTDVWSRLTLVIGYATEASLFIRDVNMSPFNVGLPLEMADFTREEVGELNARYGHPLAQPEDLARLMQRVGGQPFLVRRSLYALAVEGGKFDKLLAESASDRGVFGDHLRRFCISLHRDPELEAAVRAFVLEGRELNPEQFYRLRSAGLVVGEARQEARIRCGIYEDYLKAHLG